MINRNIDMIKQMGNLFDYKEYLSKCKEFDVEPVDLQRFCVGMGTLMVGLEMFGKEDWQESYIAAFDEIAKRQKLEVSPTTVLPSSKKKKSDCCPDKEEKKKSPNILQRGMTLAKATTEHIITGMKHVEPDEYMRRLSICKTCPSREEGFVCRECGCYMGIKASWAEQKCLNNKW